MPHAMTPRGALILLGTGLIGLTFAALALHIPGADTVGTVDRKHVFVALLAVAAVLYLLAVALVLRGPTSGGSVLIVLAVAVAMRLIVLFPQPFLSSDMYRYVPADPALQSLRDEAIYPHINRAEVAPTIYPPFAQLVFHAVARISPTVVAFKLATVLFEALACWVMLHVLDLARLPRERVLIYAWNPLAVWAFAGNGHVDAVAIGMLAVALLLRALKRDGWAGAALGAAILVKFLPAAVAPALWRHRGQRRRCSEIYRPSSAITNWPWSRTTTSAALSISMVRCRTATWVQLRKMWRRLSIGTRNLCRGACLSLYAARCRPCAVPMSRCSVDLCLPSCWSTC